MSDQNEDAKLEWEKLLQGNSEDDTTSQESQDQEVDVDTEETDVDNSQSVDNTQTQEQEQTHDSSPKPLTIDEIDALMEKREKDRQEVERKRKEEEEISRLKAEEEARKQKEAESNDFNIDKFFSEEDKKFMSDMKEEYPETHKLVEMRLTALERKIEDLLKKFIVKSFQDYDGIINQRYGNVMNHYAQESQKQQMNELLTSHPDYNQIEEDLKKWIIGQDEGSYKQGLINVYQNGSIKDLVKLVNVYKKDTGTFQVKTQTNSQEDEFKKQQDALKKEREQLVKEKEEFEKQRKINSLASARSKNSVQPEVEDESNLNPEELWKQMLKKQSK